MWYLLVNLLLLIPALTWGQAVDQGRVGFYMASKSGTDCSQVTLVAADLAATAVGQVLVLPPMDRFGVPCQWLISSGVTIHSPLFLPYKTIPVLKVAQGITATFDACPITWGDYYVIDATGSTTGTVSYSAGCPQCVMSGDDDWTQCPTAGSSGIGTITKVFDCTSGDCASITATDGDLLDMSAIAPNTTTEGLILPQTSDCSSAIAMGQACVDTDTGRLWIGNDTTSEEIVGANQDLQDVFAASNVITSATCSSTPLIIGEGGDDFWQLCIDGADIPTMTAVCDGGPCPRKETIPNGETYVLYDAEGDTPLLTVDPDAADTNAMYQFGAAYQPLVTSDVILRPSGDCTVAEESIVTNDPLDEWITCADTTGDAVAFSYKVTTKISTDTVIKISMLAVNKNASPAGTFTLDCAAQAVRPGADPYAAHNTTGEQSVSFTTFDTQSVPEAASATFTLNGTLSVGAHIKGQCAVSAAPAQIADIRLSATGSIELSANSWSD